jgi:pyruvate kinase
MNDLIAEAVPLPSHKTRIVCTIGPSSSSPEVMEDLLRAGMNVARLNFSHGDFESHGEMIRRLRAASRAANRRVAIMADLPGPKIRIGDLTDDAVELATGGRLLLTTAAGPGNADRVPVVFPRLPRVVEPGNVLFLNDGLIQLEVESVEGDEVACRVLVGGELRSRKGLNLPGIDLGISAFTTHDRACLEFALAEGVDAVSQSFVESAADVEALRKACGELGRCPFVIAKIERSRALDHLDEIIGAADGLMIARGDLGVEIPVERIAGVQKDVMRRANRAGKPVITATQMLESMIYNLLPTRAEATDVANAILDGADAVMLSGESATGRYPVEAARMLARIAADIEGHRPPTASRRVVAREDRGGAGLDDLIGLSVEAAFERASPVAVIVRTTTGATARSIARFRLPAWVLALSADEAVCHGLQFTYGVHPIRYDGKPDDLRTFVRRLLEAHGLRGELVVLADGPSPGNPEAQARMGLLELRPDAS